MVWKCKKSVLNSRNNILPHTYTVCLAKCSRPWIQMRETFDWCIWFLFILVHYGVRLNSPVRMQQPQSPLSFTLQHCENDTNISHKLTTMQYILKITFSICTNMYSIAQPYVSYIQYMHLHATNHEWINSAHQRTQMYVTIIFCHQTGTQACLQLCKNKRPSGPKRRQSEV